MEEFFVVIAGSRGFTDLKLLYREMDFLLSDVKTKYKIVIISGTAHGADKLGEGYAHDRKYGLIRMPADWTRDGNRAGMIRNEAMARKADAVVVFWDGVSPGSKGMIDICKRLDVPCRVINYIKE
jgi:hypothetical protein